MSNFLRVLILWLILLSYSPAVAQRIIPPTPGCDVLELNPTQRQDLEKQAAFALQVKRASNDVFTSITYVPIRPHILQRSDGTGGMPLASINQVIAITNSYYLLNGFGIQFYFAGTVPDTINNTNQYNSFNNEGLVATGHDATNAMNQYYVNNFSSGVGGYAYYPDNAIYSTRSFILNESWNLDDMGNRLVPHELGHNFNLIHTFGNNNGNGGSTELVTRGAGANCSTAADLVCDTPADPYNKTGAYLISVNGCPQYDPNSTARDANNQPYVPSISNIMSYYFPCTHDFTPGQYDRIQAGLALRQSHTAYTLDYPPTMVAAPSNVVASLVSNQVVLTWQDNGTNEMGYFIERSTSPTSAFRLVGGVGPNTVTFTDTKAVSYTTYYYRVKPSNSTITGISPTATITTPACRPSYNSANCTSQDGLSGFVLNMVTLSQNSGCSLGGYSSTTAISATLTAGQSYSFTGTLLSSTYTEGVGIWADLNRNGVFESGSGELLYQTPNPIAGQFSGTLTLPSSLTAGSLSIRIVVAFNTVPNDPCGAYTNTYGETEDYVINIAVPSCHPTYTNQGCNFGDGLSGFTLNGVALSQSSGCSPGSYSTYNTSLTIASGQSYPTSGTFIASGVPEGVSIWADINRNGVFETNQGELVFQTPNPFVTTQFSGSLSLPASLTPGLLTIRVVVRNGATPTDPCGTYNSGETEDYVITIINPADMSLALQASNRTPMVNQPVSYSLTMRNDGPFNATGVQWQNRLPSGLVFISGGIGVTGSSTAVSSASSISLATGQSITFTYQLQPTQPGIYLNTAQIISSDQPDSDSQPGSGTGDGQDDEAAIDIRTSLNNGTVYVSPNPNQTPLPPVLPNQPTPDPAKADLSLGMVVSTLIPALGQPITCTISISNAGGLASSSIVVRDTLRGLSFTSSPTGMSVVGSGSGYTIIEGTVASLTASSSTQLIFTATTTETGYIRNAAQIWSAATTDPDSTPGSATPTANNLNGEDDIGWINLRVNP